MRACYNKDAAVSPARLASASASCVRADVSTPAAFLSFDGNCRAQTRTLPTPPGNDQFLIRDRVVNRDAVYADLDLPLNNGGNLVMQMPYTQVPLGGRFCAETDADVEVEIGGLVMWNNGGQCSLPPTDPDDEPCCRLRIWHPNGAGYYFPECTMSCAPTSNQLKCELVFCDHPGVHLPECTSPSAPCRAHPPRLPAALLPAVLLLAPSAAGSSAACTLCCLQFYCLQFYCLQFYCLHPLLPAVL